MTGADLVVGALRNAGVQVVFALPGEENLPMVSALSRADIGLVVCRHEQHAGFMAVAHARLTGNVGVVLVTLGPGATNVFTAMAQAHLLGTPLLVITGQKSLIDNAEGSFQVLDVVGSARSLTGKAISIADPDLAGVGTVGLLRVAVDRRDAVLLELPEDVAAAEVDAADSFSPALGPDITRAAGSERIDEAVARISQAERPMLLAGIGATGFGVPEALQRLVETTGLSVLATQMGAGCLDARHDRMLGTLGMHRPDYSHLALEKSDLVITVGYQPVEHPPLAWNRYGQPVIHIAADPASVEAGYLPEIDLVGSVRKSLDALTERLSVFDTEWSVAVGTAISDCLTEERERVEATETLGNALSPLAVVTQVQEHVDRSAADAAEDVTVSLDNGLYKLWFARHFRSRTPHSLMMDNATASMGAGLANGMEAARIGRSSLVVTGDGGLMMNIGDLQTAVELKLDMTILVLRDDAFGFIGWHQEEQGRDREDVDFSNPDLVMLARSFGAQGHRVGEHGSLGELLDRSSHSPGITVIDCPIRYDHTNAILEAESLLEEARSKLSSTNTG